MSKPDLIRDAAIVVALCYFRERYPYSSTPWRAYKEYGDTALVAWCRYLDWGRREVKRMRRAGVIHDRRRHG